MQRVKAFLFLALVLCMCLSPAVQAVVAHPEDTETACTNRCCSMPSDAAGSEEDKPPVCNPFQCHSCCFMVLPVFRMQGAVAGNSFQLPQTHFQEWYRFSPGYDFWQPPRMAA